MNPLGKFLARPSLVLSIRQRRRFYAEYRREMQGKVDSWGSDETGPVSGVKNNSNNHTESALLIIYNILNIALNTFIISF